MLITIQIALGIWLGGLFLIGTVATFATISENIKRNTRYGYPWWRGLYRTR